MKTEKNSENDPGPSHTEDFECFGNHLRNGSNDKRTLMLFN